jgi:hypothetical protein
MVNPTKFIKEQFPLRKKKLYLGRRGLNGSPSKFLGKQLPKERTFLRKMGIK